MTALLNDAAVLARTLRDVTERLTDGFDEGFQLRDVDSLPAAPESVRALQSWVEELLEASTDDWSTEYLDLVMAVKVIDSVDEAISHVRQFGSGHTEAIITRDLEAADRFVRELDAAVVMVNASTRFTDGEEFGYGAEIGISTQKLHVRGPMGLEALTCERWMVQGSGQVR